MSSSSPGTPDGLLTRADWLARYLDVVDVILVWLDTDGNILHINRHGLKLLGYTEGEAVGHNWYDLVVPERERAARRGHYARMMQGAEPTEWAEAAIVTKRGEVRLIAWHRSVLADADGRITGLVGSGEDITERRRAEETLARERNMLRTLIDNVPDYIFVKDRDSRILLNNLSHTRLLGHSDPALVVGHDDFEYFPPELARQYREDELSVIESGRPLRKEELVIGADGSRHWVLVIKSPLRDANGEITGLVGLGRDITDRKRAEEALAWTAESNAALAELSRRLLTEMTVDEMSALVLDTARRLTGSEGGLVGYNEAETGRFRRSAQTAGIWLAQGDEGDAGLAFLAGSWPGSHSEHQPLLINNPAEYPRLLAAPATQVKIRNLLDVPALVGERLVGRIALIDAPDGYSQRHLSLVQRMATLYAIALERERAGHELVAALADGRIREAEIEALLQAARAVLTHDRFEDVATVILGGISRLIGAHSGFVSLLSEDRQHHRAICLQVEAGECQLDPSIPLNLSGLYRSASETGRVVYRNEIPPERLPPGHLPLQNALYAPVFHEGVVVGLLGLGNKPGGFTDEDALTGATFAELASLALHHFFAMQSLEQSEERFRSVAQSASDAIVSIDSQGTVVFWNRQAEIMFGYSSAEAIGQPLSFVVPSSARTEQEAAVWSAIREGRPLSLPHPVELTARRKDGREFSLELSLASWKTSEGQFLTGIMRDVTERRAAEQRERLDRQAAEIRAAMARTLQEQRPLHDRLADVVRQLKQVEELRVRDAAVFLVDPNTERLERLPGEEPWQNAMCSAETVERGECLCGLAFDKNEIVVCEDCTKDEQHIFCLEGVAPHGTCAVPLIHAGRPVGVLCLSTPLGQVPRDPSRLHLLRQIGDLVGLAVANDRLQDELRKARQVAEEMSRAKSAFLASMSHELRTPLNTILGVSEALQEGVYGPFNEKQENSIRNIGDSGRHLLDLINDILDLSKIEAGQLDQEIGPQSVEEICALSLQLVRQLAVRKRLTVSSVIDERATIVMADPRHLKQILVNLLSNAIKFTPEEGKIGLDVSAVPELGELHFTVWDSGIGIADEDLPRLFQPFVQLDNTLSRQYAGSGLGLSLVRRMVELHGGRVWVVSQVDRGSRFTFALPWDPSQELRRNEPDNLARGDVAPAEPAGPVTADESPLILVVEDNEYNLSTLSDYLRTKGYRMEVARDGVQAVERSKELKPNLILMDVQMPGLDGLEATRRIRQDESLVSVPIIALTSGAMREDRDRCLAAGVSDYLSKPVSLRELARTVESHLRRKTNP